MSQVQATQPVTDASIDLNDPLIFHHEAFFRDPYATFAAVRRQGELVRLNFWGGVHYVGGYDTLAKTISEPRLSHDLSRFWAQLYSPEQNQALSDFARLFGLWMAHYDGPRHLRLRNLLSKAFSCALQTRRQHIESVIRRSVDALPRGETFDLIQGLAYPLPARVISALLEIDDDRFDLFMACADDLIALTGSTKANFVVALRTQSSLLALTSYLQELIARRRREPGDDLISLMIGADDGGAPLTDDEIHGQCAMMLFAGHETTRNLIGNGMLSLLQHPQQLALLQSEPGLMRRAIEEILRFQSPVQLTVRGVTEDFELCGKPLRRGEHVVFNFGSANRDERKFSQPDRFDIRREEERHVAFGVGPHTCVGARLSALEGQLAFAALFERFPRLRMLEQEPRWHPNAGFRGLSRLMVSDE